MSDASWWASLRHGGLLLSPAQVARLDAAPLAPFPSATAERLRRAIVRATADDLPASARTAAQSDLLTLLLEEVAGLQDAARSAPRPASAPAAPAGHWLRGAEVDASLTVRSVTGEAIRPRRLWLGGNGARLPVFFSDEARLGVGRGKRAPARLLEWLRARGERLAILASPTQLRLAYAGADHDAFCEWDLALFFPEGEPGPQVEALRRLLSPQLLVPPKPGGPAPLLRLVLDARKGQADLSSTLGERVRRAVELLVASHAPALAALEERGRALPHEAVYRAAVRVVMRLVVLLFAEARPDLLPRENPVFHGSYSLAGLRESLERQGSGGGRERLRQQAEGWPRVLALFRLLHAGSHHEALPVPRYGGRLFEPGDAASPDPQSRAVALLESAVFDPALHGVMTDADVALLLDLLTRTKATMRQGTRTVTTTLPVDFESLSTEFIGILYEGLLDYELRRAAPGDPVLFLDLGDQPALPLSRLTALSDAALSGLVEKLKAKTKPAGEEDESAEEDGAEEGEEAADEEAEATEATPAGEDAPLAVEAGAPPEAEPGGDGAVAESGDAHLAAWNAALAWARRAVVAGGLAPKPRGRKPEALAAHAQKVEGAARGLLREVVVPGGYFLVRWGGTRKGAGTFYTRPQLAGPTARRTLQPLLYADDGTPRRPEEILALKVCDPAMGSGSFLVSALRLLVKALFASLHHHARVAPHGAGSRVVVTLPEGTPATGRLVEELLPCLPDDPDFEPRLLARLKRHVVERCLYGVDLDPLAVELAQLSLWIETLDRSLPFEFLDHKLKAGNSLVGAWFDRYRDYPLLAWEREGGDEKHDGVHHLKTFAPARGRAAGKEKTTGDLWGAAIKEAYARAKADLGDLLDGQQGLFDPASGPDPGALHDEAVAAFEALHALPPHDPDGVAELYRERVLGSPSLAALREAFDAWCALWFWPADRLDLAPLPSTFDRLAPEARAVVAEVAARERFFHWELEFPDVFARPGSGFDAILGNPPWEIQKPSSKEFFSNLDPLYRAYGKQEALKRQREIFEANAADEEAWLAYVSRFKALSGFTANAAAPFGDPAQGEGVSLHRSPSRSAERHGEWRSRRGKVKGYADREHPFRHQGSADVNTYKLFLEEAHALLRPGGRLGFLVPSGLYTDKGAIALRRLFLERCRWTHLYAFQNERFLFEAVDHRFKALSLCVEKGGSTEAVLTRFRLGPGDSPEVTELETDIPADERYLPVRADQIARLSPRSLALLEIRHPRDLEVLEKIYAGSVLLGDDSEEGWGITYAREFDMTNDSELFPRRPVWEAKGYRSDEYGRWVGPEGDVALPLYEGRMVDFFDPAQKAWVSGSARQAVWTEISWAEKRPAAQFLMAASTHRDSACAVPPDDRGAKVGFLDVTAATNERTMVSTVLPPWPCGNTVPVLRTSRSAFGLSAVLNSYAFDLVMRNRCGGVHLNYFVIEDAPLPHPAAMPNSVRDLSLRLGSSTSFMAEAWRSLSTNRGRPWRSLWAITPQERLRLRALLDAVVAELYGLDFDDLAWILRDCDHPAARLREKAFCRTLDPKGFWRVDKEKDPELRHTVLSLAAFRDLKALIAAHGGDREKGIAAFCDAHDGDGWMLPETLRLADLGLGHDDRARERQPVASRLGERFLPWQLAQSVEESWAECERHARILSSSSRPT